MKVTVLMPVYNAEKYLHDSIGSLLAQTSNQWKLICVDDGSTDNSLTILNDYANQDCRITVLSQVNAGPAVARARAIEIADTEYVSILDSDDAYSVDYVEKMLKRAVETDADSIVPDVEFGYANTKKIPNKFIEHKLDSNMVINDGKEAFSMTIPWKLHGWQMFRTSLAKTYYTVNNVSYSNFNSDEYITRLLYLKSSKIALCEAKYLYRIGEGSITRTASLKKLDSLLTIRKLIELINNERVNGDVLLRLYNEFHVTIKNSFLMIQKLPFKEQIEGKKVILDSYKNVYCKNMSVGLIHKAPIRTKIKLLLSLLSYRFIL